MGYINSILKILLSVTTVAASIFTENNIEQSDTAISPPLQPLLLIYHRYRQSERFSLAMPELRNDAVIIPVPDGNELWLGCSKEIPEHIMNLNPNIDAQAAIVKNEEPESGWQLSHTFCAESNQVVAAAQFTGVACGPKMNGRIYNIGYWIYMGSDDEEPEQEQEDTSYSARSSHGKKKPSPKKYSSFKKLGSIGRLAGLSIGGESSSPKTKSPKKKHSNIDNNMMDFVVLYQSCFDDNSRVVLFTTHTIHGAFHAVKDRINSIPALPDQQWSYSDSDLSNLYEKETQFTNFEKILQNEDSTLYNDRVSKFLVPLHLTPVEDMIFYTWRSAAFVHHNVTPQWETIRGRGWRIVEETALAIARRENTDITVATGTYQTLMLGERNRRIFLFPEARTYTVPKYIWKVLYNEDTKAAVVFIASNNPHLAACEPPSCQNTCPNKFSPNDPLSGCIICCSHSDAMRVINGIPFYDVMYTLNVGS